MGLIINKAYQLWSHTGIQESHIERKEKIISQLFQEIQNNHPRDVRFKSIFKYFYKAWLQIKVKEALAAYKYDLFTTGNANKHLNLFNEKERWFIDAKINKVFKNFLIKSGDLNLANKGRRWSDKVTKYYKKPDFLIGNFLLDKLRRTSPKWNQAVMYMGPLPKNKLCKAAVKIIDDQELINGVIRYLEKPLGTPRRPKDILYTILFYATYENAKWAVRTSFERINKFFHFHNNPFFWHDHPRKGVS